MSDPPLEGRTYHQAANQSIVYLVHAPRMNDVLQVRPQGEPIGDLGPVVDLGTVLIPLYRQVTGIVIVGDVIDLVDQTLPLADVISDTQPTDGDTDRVALTRMKGPLIVTPNV